MDQLMCASLFPHSLDHWYEAAMCDTESTGGTVYILLFTTSDCPVLYQVVD